MAWHISLRPRDEVSRLLSWGIGPLVVVAALLISAIPIVISGADPLGAYYGLLVKPLTTTYGISETLVKMIPLLLTGLAVYLPYRAGLWNVGAEGQLYVGAIVTAWVGLRVHAPWIVLLTLMVTSGALVGAFWGLIPGYLRAKWGVNEILVSLLMVFIATNLDKYVVLHPLKEVGGYPASPELPVQIPHIAGTQLHYGIAFAAVGAIAVYLLLEHTPTGYKITVMGSNSQAAVESGISPFQVYLLTMTIGGLLAGLAGASLVAGVLGRLRVGVSPGYGFTAIPIALLGRNGIPQIVVASFFFALLFTGNENLQALFGLPYALTNIIQALVILFILVGITIRRYRVRIVRTTEGASD